MRFWIALALVAGVLIVGFAVAPALLSFGAGAVILLALVTYLASRWRDGRARRRFRETYGSAGRDLLLVYSRSPTWQSYIESSWLPRWGGRAVLLNWSDRRQWDPARPEVALFRALAGPSEFNPLAIVVPRTGEMRVVRFWRAFRDFKHGKDATLRTAEAEVEQALMASSRGDV